jgi:hypothetical protein
MAANHLGVDALVTTLKCADEPPRSPGSHPEISDSLGRSQRKQCCLAHRLDLICRVRHIDTVSEDDINFPFRRKDRLPL